MCKIKIKTVPFLILLQILLVATAAFEETCESDREMEEMCRIHNYKTVKPLLDYFRQVRNELEDNEIKEKKLNELNSDLMEKYHEIVRIHERFLKEAALLDEYKNKVMKGENDLQLCHNKVEKLESKINTKQYIIAKLKGGLGNCELQLKTLNSSSIDKDQTILRLNDNIQNITEHQKIIELQLEQSKTKLIKQNKNIQLCQSEIVTVNRTSENIKEQQKNELQLKESDTKLIDKVKENLSCRSELDKLSPTTCIPFGDYPGVHQLNVSGVGLFDVLCDSQLAGHGWIVIQQRVGGNESFNRDWATYRKGFGSYKSDFFLGLEKIHRITSLQRFELYIHLVDMDGNVYFARYDDFKISDEDNGYTLSLGNFNGTIEDALRYHENMKFSTFDHDNDEADYYICAVSSESGWWHKTCYECNLNAPYGPALNWGVNVLKEGIKMLIRPKETMNE